VYEDEKAKFNEGKFNQDFATNSRESTFAKTQQRCKHGKQIILFIFGSGWHIGKLEIRESHARHVNNQASNMNSKVALSRLYHTINT
jgi:hypothetical protein